MSFKTALVAGVAALAGAALAALAVQATSTPDTTAVDEAAAELRVQMQGLEETIARTDRRLDGMDRDLKSLRRSVDGVGDGVRGLAEGVERLRAQAATPRTVRTPTAAHGFGAPKSEDKPAPKAPVANDLLDAGINPNVAKLMRDLLESDEDSVRFPAATELGRIGKPEGAVPALASAVRDDDHFLVRRAAARSLGILRAWYGVPALIAALEDKEAYVGEQANFSLKKITGQDFGVTQKMSLAKRVAMAKVAQRWWDQNQGSPPDGVSLVFAE